MSVVGAIGLLLVVVYMVSGPREALLSGVAGPTSPPASAPETKVSPSPPTANFTPASKTVAVTHSQAPNGLPPVEFRGIKWGAAPTKMMQKIGDGVWKNPNKNLKPYFDIPVAEEGYLFEDGKLFAGQLFFDGADNFAKLKAALTKQFGTPNFANESSNIFSWKWQRPEVVLKLYYQEKFQRTTVALSESHDTRVSNCARGHPAAGAEAEVTHYDRPEADPVRCRGNPSTCEAGTAELVICACIVKRFVRNIPRHTPGG